MADMLLTIPLHIYQKAQDVAEKTAQPVETVLLEYLEQSFNEPFANR